MSYQSALRDTDRDWEQRCACGFQFFSAKSREYMDTKDIYKHRRDCTVYLGSISPSVASSSTSGVPAGRMVLDRMRSKLAKRKRESGDESDDTRARTSVRCQTHC